VKSRLSLTTIVAWLGRIPGVPAVKIFEKRFTECGHETAAAVLFPVQAGNPLIGSGFALH